jgi:hypothetical protein
MGYPYTHRKVASVYCIDGVYVGTTIHTRVRILSHLHSAMNNSKTMNPDFVNYLQHKVKNNIPINVYYLNDNLYLEGFYIDKIKPIYNRTNISTYVYKKVKK